MSRTRLTLGTTLCAILFFGTTLSASAPGTIVLDLRRDPLDATGPGPSMFVEGPGSGAFAFESDLPPVHHGDRAGALLATYDSTEATSRAALPLGRFYTEEDDFAFGAVLTIRSDGFEPDPFGFHPITFSLVNGTTTGYDRTGDLSDFRADTFDSLDFAWFPQVSPFFGGPFLAPAVFGAAVSDDAFANFAFASTLFDVGTDLPRLVTLEHVAEERSMIVTIYGFSQQGEPEPIPGGRVEVDLSRLTGFAVDTLAVTLYEDGFNVFSSSGRSLRADVEYHRLFFTRSLIDPEMLRTLLRRGGPRGNARPEAPGAHGPGRSEGGPDPRPTPSLGVRDQIDGRS